MKKIYLLLLYLIVYQVVISQERVVSSGYFSFNHKIKNLKTLDTIELPLIDDFSETYPELNSNYWETNGVSIGITEAVNPPSIGFAVFDNLDSLGEYYPYSYGIEHIADILTSKPINLHYIPADNIYLSFFYQAQGRLDYPNLSDSLILEFYAPKQNKWRRIWSVPGYSEHIATPQFRQVVIPIVDTAFLHYGFKFRFYNKASLGSSQYPDLVGNSDFWFIDYIRLDKNRSQYDTLIRDVALQYPIVFNFDNYTVIPYTHYKEVLGQINVNSHIFIRNNDNTLRSIDSLYVLWREKNEAVADNYLYFGSYILPPLNDAHVDADNINFSFPIGGYSALYYKIKTHIRTDAFDFQFNNDFWQDKNLDVQYAYDDATAENGYGLVGQNTKFAYVAQKFYTYKTDNLSAVRIFFNKTYHDEQYQPYYFTLVVWENDPQTGKPGEIIYEKQGCEINHNNLNKFQTFIIDTQLTVSDTFYIGWQKTSELFLNVGLDINANVNNIKFYNIYGYWQSSQYDGALMIRPVFGDPALKTENLQQKLKIYPIPANDYIFIELSTDDIVEIEIFNSVGQIILKQSVKGTGAIDISSLNTGIYLLKIHYDGKMLYKKIVKN